MAALLQQRSGRALGVACRPEFAAFEAIKSRVRGKEAISPLVSGNNPSSSVLDFDDVGLGHVCPSTNDPVFTVSDDDFALNRKISNRRRWPLRNSAASCADAHFRTLVFDRIACGNSRAGQFPEQIVGMTALRSMKWLFNVGVATRRRFYA